MRRFIAIIKSLDGCDRSRISNRTVELISDRTLLTVTTWAVLTTLGVVLRAHYEFDMLLVSIGFLFGCNFGTALCCIMTAYKEYRRELKFATIIRIKAMIK